MDGPCCHRRRAFIDPLFSTGIPLTLLGIERIADAWRREASVHPPSNYGEATTAEADHTARFIAGCYAAFPQFDVFTAYSMFYFAAASFSEMQRRLSPERASGGFLRAAVPGYVQSLRALSPAGCSPGRDYVTRVANAIEPINVAGLCNAALQNWYPVDVEDTIRAAAKLGLSSAQVRDQLTAMISL
jgi:FADH2 O2-dependent halogenase